MTNISAIVFSILFVILFSVFLLATIILVGLALRRLFFIKKITKKRFLIVFSLVCLAFFSIFFLSNLFTGVISKIMYIASGRFIALFLYTLLSLLLTDILRIVCFPFFKNNKQRLIILAKYTLSALLIISTLFVAFGIYRVNNFTINKYDVCLSNDNKKDANSSAESYKHEVKAVFVSDIHLGKVYGVKSLTKIVNGIMNQSPDLILLGGDLFDQGVNTLEDKEKIAEQFSRLTCPIGTFACLGNHDEGFSNNKSDPSFISAKDFLSDCGISVLINEAVTVDDKLNIFGLDATSNSPSYDNAIDTWVENDLPSIMLSHVPINDKNIKSDRISLILSGHTHDGQMFPLNLITNAIYSNSYGYATTDNGTQSIVSSGVGSWGPSVRTSAPPEIIVINMHFN